MASVGGVSKSNYVSSLYNSSNIISGLASGMDTEGMIESLTQSYQKKITQLQQKQTKISWKQDAYRSIISKMYAYSNKYTSYTSSSNLRSQSFWNSAQSSAVQGEYANKVSASGTTTSDVVLNSVKQLATAARYVSEGKFTQSGSDPTSITAGTGIDLEGTTEVNALQGGLSLTYGNKIVSMVFTESDKIEAQKKADGTMETQDEALARVINEKLSEETIALSSGSSVAASERIKAEVSGGKITFKPVDVGSGGGDKAGNSIYVSGGSGVFENVVPEDPDEKKVSSIDLPKSYDFNTVTDKDTGETRFFRKDVSNISKISGATMNINLDGTTKKVTMPTIKKNEDGSYQIGDTKVEANDDKDAMKAEMNKAFTSELEKAVKKEFGDKIAVTNADTTGKSLQLDFKVAKGSNLLINTDAGDALGIGKTATNYLNTSKTLEDLGVKFDGLTPSKDKNGKVIEGKYDFEINGKVIGSYDKDTKLSDILSDINNKSDVKVSYSKTSREFVFTTKDTGAQTEVKLGDGLAKAMFDGGKGSKGQDSKFTVTVNGTEMEMERNTNSVEIDGLTINFKGTFNPTYNDPDVDKKSMEGVTFQKEIQSDKVVDEVKNMIAELNVILAEARSNYATLPQQYSNGSIKEYEPLTDEDMASMSETAIKNYEEKAKQGLLFADSNLSGLYQNIVSVFTRTGEDRTMMEKMGIGLSYDNNGAATITFNEKKFTEALESDFEGVVDIFTRSKENGAATDGIMEGIKTQMDRYGSTTGTVKGILVQQAGTPLASLTLLDNGWQKEINNYSTQIEKWQEKLQSQVDRYTKMFTRLETLMNQMNSQSSQLASLMGGQ